MSARPIKPRGDRALLADLDAEIDELFSIRESLVEEMREAGMLAKSRHAVVDHDEDGVS